MLVTITQWTDRLGERQEIVIDPSDQKFTISPMDSSRHTDVTVTHAPQIHRCQQVEEELLP